MSNVNQNPLVKLPVETQTILFLIREELKSRKLFHALRQAGIEGECYFQPRLDALIIHTLGLDDSDETFSFYDRVLEKRSHKIEANRDSVTRQALKAYHQLLSEKRRIAAKV